MFPVFKCPVFGSWLYEHNSTIWISNVFGFEPLVRLCFYDKCYLNNENSDNSQQLGSDGVRGLLLHGHVLHGWATPTPSACVHLVLDVGREQLDDQGAHALFQQDTKLKKKEIKLLVQAPSELQTSEKADKSKYVHAVGILEDRL